MVFYNKALALNLCHLVTTLHTGSATIPELAYNCALPMVLVIVQPEFVNGTCTKGATPTK